MELTIGSSLSFFLGERKSVLYGFGILQALLFLYFVCYYSEYIWYFPLALLGLVYLWFSWKYPLVWVGSAILLHIPLFIQNTETITANEVLIGLYIMVPLGLWFYRRLIGARPAFLFSNSDYFFAGFFLLSLASIVLAVINGFELSRWVREILSYSWFLLYFPIRETIKKRNDLWFVVIPFLILAAVIAAHSVFLYRTGAGAAEYLWEIFGARKARHEPLLMATIILSIAYLVYSYSVSWKVTLASTTAFFSAALLVTFSRGYWLATIFALLLMFVFLDPSQKTKFIFLLFLFGLASIVVFFAFFGELANSILKGVAVRLVRASALLADPSLRNRESESAALFREIFKSPILGHGLGATFTFHNTILQRTQVSDYSHNAYLFLWFKLGIVGLITFLSAYLLKLRDCYRAYRKVQDRFVKSTQLGIFCTLTTMLLISVTSPQFHTRNSILIIALAWAIIDATTRGFIPEKVSSSA
jgi:O-antigen ligase